MNTLKLAVLAVGKFALGWAVFVLLWWAAIQIWDIEPLTLPSPGAVWDAAQQNRDILIDNLWITLRAALLAFAISAVLGLAIALLLSTFKTIRAIVFPVIVAIQAAPKVALAPLFVVWIGFGTKVAVFVGVLVAVFPMIVNSTAGLSAVDNEMVMLAKSMRASTWQIFIRIRLPHALPHIVSGLKTTLVLALVGVVVGELTGAGAGLGYKVAEQSAVFRSDYAFAAVLVLIMLSLVLFYAIEILERRLAWYAKLDRRTEESSKS